MRIPPVQPQPHRRIRHQRIKKFEADLGAINGDISHTMNMRALKRAKKETFHEEDAQLGKLKEQRLELLDKELDRRRDQDPDMMHFVEQRKRLYRS